MASSAKHGKPLIKHLADKKLFLKCSYLFVASQHYLFIAYRMAGRMDYPICFPLPRSQSSLPRFVSPRTEKKAIEITNLFRATQTMAPLPLPRFVSPRTEKRRLRLLICFVQHKPWHHCHCLGSCLLESKKRRLRLSNLFRETRTKAVVSNQNFKRPFAAPTPGAKISAQKIQSKDVG